MALKRRFRFPTELLLWGLLVVGGGYLLGAFMYTGKASYFLQRMRQWNWSNENMKVLGVKDSSSGVQVDVVKILDFWIEYPLCSDDNPGIVVFKFQSHKDELMRIRVVIEFPEWMQVRPVLDGKLDFRSNAVFWDLQLEPYVVREVAAEIYGPLQQRQAGYIRAKVFVDNEVVEEDKLPVSTLYACADSNRSQAGDLSSREESKTVSRFRMPTGGSFSLVLEDTSTINCACYNKSGTFLCKYYKEVDANIRCETWCKARGFEFGEKTRCEDLAVIYGH